MSDGRALRLLHEEGKLKLLERHTIVAPLGIRFVDAINGTTVGDGLEVSVWPEDVPAQRVPMRPTRGGLHAAHRLPGMRDFERGAGDDEFWREWLSRQPRTFVVEAFDTLGRFLPLELRVNLPARGPVKTRCPLLLPSGVRDAVPMFSSVTRVVTASTACIRADLWDHAAGRPAAWAVVDARFDGRLLARGMSDARGQAALFFAYPEPQGTWTSPPVGSPSSPPRLPLAEQRWDVEISARYARMATVPRAPDLCAALMQPSATLLADAGSPAQRLTRTTLRYGQEVVLRTANTLPNERGRLLLETTGSPA